MIQTLRKFRGGGRPSKFGGGQSREIFRGGPVKKITLYLKTHLREKLHSQNRDGIDRAVQANLGGASLETFSGEGQLKKHPVTQNQ